jgi:hypothetical protein
MYHKDFIESVFDPHLLSSFIVAMTTFFDEAARSITSRARAFEGSDYTIIVEFGDWTMAALLIETDTARIRGKMKRILQKFEEQFNLLRWVDLDLAVYSRFERIVLEEFVRDEVLLDSVIRVRPHWEFRTRNPDVVSFLRLLPEVCTVKDAAEFLEVPVEIALNLVAEAIWDNAIMITQSVKPDDIYQATTLIDTTSEVDGISPETVKALAVLDGETPLAIAAEKLKTSDLKRFLEDVAILAERKAVERISPARSVTVLYTAAIQDLLNRAASILGSRATRDLFFKSREKLEPHFPWISFVDLEEGVDIEIKSSLTAATMKGQMAPDVLSVALRSLLMNIADAVGSLTGPTPMKMVVSRTREEIEKQYPSMALDIEWESMLH